MSDDDNPFTSPDPADDHVEPAFDADEFEAVTSGDDGDLMLVDAEASCLKCEHFEVCAVYAAYRPIQEDWHTKDNQDSEFPIELSKLAWICDEYEPTD